MFINEDDKKKETPSPEVEVEHDSKKETTELKVNESTQAFLNQLNSNGQKEINPFIDFNEGKVRYPILLNAGQEDDNIKFLDDLVQQGLLQKEVYERLLVCPSHPKNISSNIRLYCPVCNSPNVEKLQLYEHKICGHITESKNFEIRPENSSLKCPSCKKEIKKPERELRQPAKWYHCFECSSRFDNVSIKLRCRQFVHDFDPASAKTMLIHRYKLKNNVPLFSADDLGAIDKVKKILEEAGFNTEKNYSIQTKKERSYNVDLYGWNNKKQSVFVFVNRNRKNIEEADLDSIIVSVLDAKPDAAILIGTSISPQAKEKAESYDIFVVEENELENIGQRASSIINSITMNHEIRG